MADNTYYKNYFEKKFQDTEEKAERSYAEQMLPVYVVSKIGSILIHVLSFIAASILPAYWLSKSLGVDSGIYFVLCLIFTGGCIFLFIEVPKYTLTKVAVENRHNKEPFSHYWVEVLALLFIVGTSIALSTGGSELMDDYLNPAAETVDIMELQDNYDSDIEKKTAYWDNKIEEAEQKVTDYYNANKKYYASEGKERLSSAKAIQEPYKLLQETAAGLVEDKRKDIDELMHYKKENTTRYTAENTQSIEQHKLHTDIAGTFLFWFMLALELIYVALVYFIHYYDYRGRKEREGIEEIATQSKEEENQRIADKVKKMQGEAKKKAKQSKESEVPVFADTGGEVKRNMISFGKKEVQHGQIIMKEGWKNPKMWYEKKNGELTLYTQKKLERMANESKASEARKQKLMNLVNKEEWNKY